MRCESRIEIDPIRRLYNTIETTFKHFPTSDVEIEGTN